MLSWIKVLSKVKFWNLGSPSPSPQSCSGIRAWSTASYTGPVFFCLDLVCRVSNMLCSHPQHDLWSVCWTTPSYWNWSFIQTQSRHHPGFFLRRNFQKLKRALVWYALSVYRNPEAIDGFLILIPTNGSWRLLEASWNACLLNSCNSTGSQGSTTSVIEDAMAMFYP